MSFPEVTQRPSPRFDVHGEAPQGSISPAPKAPLDGGGATPAQKPEFITAACATRRASKGARRTRQASTLHPGGGAWRFAAGSLSPANWMRVAAVLLLACVAGCTSRPDSDTRKEDQARAILEQADGTQTSMPPGPASLPVVPSTTSLRAGKRLPHYTAVAWSSLPAWQADDYSVVWHAFLRNCQAILERGLKAPGSGSPVAAARPWLETCRVAFDPAQAPNADDPQAVQTFLQARLQPWMVTNAGKPAVNTVTGYYEPLVYASRERGGEFQWPLYAVPDDMLVVDLGSLYPELAGKRVRGKLVGQKVVPYHTRSEIESNSVKPDAIVWVNDPIDAFFLQVQGSGRALLKGGSDAGRVIRLAYADQNGHPYTSIGRWLVDQGELTLEQASMQSIKEWARRNPHRVSELLNVNPSVVFFREEPVAVAGEGPRGAFAVPLTAQHSIAVDPVFVPLGSPVLLSTTYPGSQKPLNRVVFAQDTGSAIKGAGRADFYWGFGEEAGALAGRMKQNGRMWVLWPKGEGAPAADVN